MIGTQAFQDAFETAQQSVFRLERLQHYAGDPNFDRFLRGELWEDTDSKRHWVDLVQRRTRDGVSMQRVHVIEQPWSDYVRFEITWSYPPNAAAGEDIRVTTVQHDAWSVGDFWMFDDTQVWTMRYSPDGELTGVEDVSERGSVVAACRGAKALALSVGQPLGQVPASL